MVTFKGSAEKPVIELSSDYIVRLLSCLEEEYDEEDRPKEIQAFVTVLRAIYPMVPSDG